MQRVLIHRCSTAGKSALKRSLAGCGTIESMPQPDLYDLVAYPGTVYPSTHPGNLAAIALLHELEAPPVESCRVLEIGCNEGQNLIPMACAIPTSEFLGIDLAAVPIARGQQRIRQLGLANIRLLQADLMDLSAEFGAFDYILIHGVYAWVPDPVRDRIFSLVSELLTPNGVAFVSYNALPGGHIRNLVGDILRQGNALSANPAEALQQGIELLRMLAASRPDGDPLGVFLKGELERLLKRDPNVVVHDELSSSHRPVSYTEFTAHAARHGLQPLDEATFPPPSDPLYHPQLSSVARTLSGGDPIAFEQALDTFRLRRYRETLLCRAGLPLSDTLSMRYLDRLSFACAAVPAGSAPGSRLFQHPRGGTIESRHPGTVALLECLIAAWPEAVPFVEAAEHVVSRGFAVDAKLIQQIFQLVVSQAIQLRSWRVPVSQYLEARPAASALARFDAASGADQTTTLLHTSFELSDPVIRSLVVHLDGTRDRGALLEALQAHHPEAPLASLAEGLEPSLQLLHRLGALQATEE